LAGCNPSVGRKRLELANAEKTRLFIFVIGAPKRPTWHDKAFYRERNRIERCFNDALPPATTVVPETSSPFSALRRPALDALMSIQPSV
jgi:hypothetical protein